MVGEGFVLLTHSTTSNEIRDKNRKTGPPEVTFNNGFGVKASKMTREGGVMDGME